MTWFFDLRVLPRGGGCAQSVAIRRGGDYVSWGEFLAATRGRNLLLATHGFNVDRASGVEALSRWHGLLQLPPSTEFVGVLWPGDSRFLPAVDYPFEGEEAMAAGRLLGGFVNGWLQHVPRISLASHSLGARMVLETVRTLDRRVAEMILMAGAIDNDCLVREYRDAAAKVDRVSVLSSTADFVLQAAFPIGNFFGGLVSAGHPYHRAALGRNGPVLPCPASVQAGWQIPGAWDYGHLDYLPTAPPPGSNPHGLPVDVLPEGAPAPAVPGWGQGWKPAWSAAFVTSRYA